jgi:hypothetical protein
VLLIDRMNRPGQRVKIASEPAVLHYSTPRTNYEKRAMMHHASCLGSFPDTEVAAGGNTPLF